MLARRARIGTWLAVTLSFACAALLLYLSAPRAVAAFLALPGDRVAAQMENDGRIDSEAAESLIDSRRRHLLWADAPRAWAELGFAEQSLAYSRSGPERRPDRRALEQAMDSFEKALAGSPADATAWLNLAALRYALDGPTEATAKAFSMALLTGPVMIRQTVFRLDFAFRLWPLLSPEDRRLVLQIIHAGWHHASYDIVALATTPLRAGIIRAAFASDPATLATFETLLAQARKRVPD